MPDWPFDRLLVPIRGGMKYPTPKERLTMTYPDDRLDDQPEINLEDLDTLVKMREQLDTLIREKQDAAKKRRIPAVPPASAGSMFRVRLKYTANGPAYSYLIFRAPAAKGWYTTATDPRFAKFESWRELVEWLRGPDVYWHGVFQKLTVTDETYLAAEHPNV